MVGPSAVNALNVVPQPEMQNVNIRNVLDHFGNINDEVRAFCEFYAEHYANIAQTPRSVPSGSSATYIHKPISDFVSVFDFVFFTLTSILNTHFHRDIFEPFHPAAMKEENLKTKLEYERQKETGTCTEMKDISLTDQLITSKNFRSIWPIGVQNVFA